MKVATASGEIELSPATHERILTALRHLPPAVALNAFEHAGVSRAVELDDAGKSELLHVVRSLALEAEADDDMPLEGLIELRDGLLAELEEVDGSSRPWAE